ncbi:MAG: hypothetical protein HND58_03955 [Planctomycetota bacterium]|nr:MAG: hypothetical protein HND58_03955 [Planctomycetota bacterium]
MKSRHNRSDARSLRQRAGRASRYEAHFEPLEERKLLFSLSITPDMDADGDGLGTASATFGYTIPYADSDVEVADGDPEAIDEDFNDEGVGPVASGSVFLESNIRVLHGFGFTNNFRVAQPDPDDDNIRYLDINASDGSFWTFEPWVVDDETGQLISRISAIQASFTVGGGDDNQGLLPNDFLVDILFFDEVTATYTGDQLIAQNTSGNAGERANGVGTFVFDADDTAQAAMTGIRVRSTIGENVIFDDLQFLTAPGLFADIVQGRIFGAEFTFTAPIGATVNILDLYGREMVQTIALGKPDQINLTLVDGDDDGVPNFNDGIGRVTFSGVDSRATFTMFGGTIEYDNTLGFQYTRVDNFLGLYDDFEAAGFGYHTEYDDDGTPTNFGLPAGPGSVIFGSPFVRDNSDSGSYNPAGSAGGNDDFNDPDQGVFVSTGESMGTVYIHGAVHGSSRFTGALGDIYFGNLMGSLTVDGDLGSVIVGGDAGFWVSDDGANQNVLNDSVSEITVGRSLREYSVGGRSAVNITVRGDLNSPALRPPGEIYRHIEHEKIYAYNDGDVEDDEVFIIGDILFPASDFFGSRGNLFAFTGGRAPIYVDSTYRNDTILGSEFVGNASSGIEIAGNLGYGDPINGEDGNDVYAFVSDGSQPIDIQVNTLGALGYVRVVDQNGVPIAATVFEDSAFGFGLASTSQNLRFTPPRAGTFYLEISDIGVNLVNGDNTDGWEYLITITGLTPVTFGSYRTGGSTGIATTTGPIVPSLQTITGDFGIIRTGVGYVDSSGTDASYVEITNRPDDEDTPFDVIGASFATSGNLYSFVAGSDVTFMDLFVNGDLGEFYSGMSPFVGLTGDGLEGDVVGTFLTVSGRIGLIDIKGGVGLDNDVDDPPVFIVGVGLDIRTGLDGGDGSIGSIRIGGDVNGGTLTLNTSSGSVVGSLLVSQDRGEAGEGIYNDFFLGSDFNLGTDSDIRFVDFPRIDNLNNADQSFALVVGQSVEFVDDSGGIFQIEVQGPINGGVAGQIRVLPLDNGQGVAVARIDGVDLTGGRSLRITSTGLSGNNSGEAPISIGRIAIAAADAQSSVVIAGTVEIDVWQITSAAALNSISNRTPGGDIVAIDVAGLLELEISDGNLGRTQAASYGTQDFGVFLGIAASEQTAVGGPLGVSDAALADGDGDISDGFRPVGAIDAIYLEDIGAPLDPYLNGVVVRGGNLNNVLVSGAIGDVILQGGGTLANVVADNDFIAGVGQLDGIFGSIYAGTIDTVDVGQGLLNSAIAPFAGSGIFASDEIRNVEVDALLHEGAFLAGVVIASDIVPGSGPLGDPDIGGIETINIDSGTVRDAYIGAMSIDAFLTSYVGLGEIYTGNIGRIGGTDLTIFRSRIEALNLNNLSLGDGVYDATVTNVGNNLGNVDVRVARNSTIGGGEFEFGFNRITVAGNIGTFEGGEVSDLRVEAVGRVTGSVESDSWRRVEFVVNGTVPTLTIADTMVGTEISVGRLGTLTADAIRTSQISVSGELTSVSSTTEIYNTTIEVTGAQGRIGSVTAASRFVGSVSATGPIGSITATSGDLDVSVTTTTDRGTVGSISASGDLILESSISAGLGSVSAGGNIGNPGDAGLIFVKGDLASITAGGHLYTDVRVGQTLTSATIGRAVNRPGQPMARSGSFFVAEAIESIAITGDFGGSIVSFTSGIQSVTITNGSLLSTGGLSAYNGNIESLAITGGNLYGDLYTDRSIVSVVIEPSADGVFGDVGVNPSFSAGVGYDAFRGQLPPGVAQTSGKDGPNIVAEVDIESFVVSGGNIYEATLFAGQTVRSIDVTGRIIAGFTPGNTGRPIIAAGEEITSIAVTSNVNRAVILAGVRSLGDDLDAGGFGSDTDTNQSGRIVGMTVGGNLTNTQIAAGTNPGSDREYNTGDDLLEIGISSVGAISVAGTTDGSSVYSDRLLAGSKAGGKLAWGGPFRPVNNGDIATSTAGTQLTKGANFNFSTSSGEGFIRFTGPGNAFFDAATNRVILNGTTGASNLLVHANGDNTLTDFDVVSTEGASAGLIRVEASLLGDSDIVVDENITSLELGQILGTGTIQAGASLTSFTSGSFRGGELIARDGGAVVVNGEYGDSDRDIRGEVIMSFVTLESARFTGAMRGDLSVRESVTSVAAPAGISGGLVHAGERIGSITADEISRTRISAGRSLGTLSVTNDLFDSAVLVGGDLGDDAEIGGTAFDADSVAAGTIGTITIGGDFVVSDIVAGYLRGPDGFFGTGDDLLASGRSSIGSVTIGGDAVGSNTFSESYRIASTGSLGTITAGGQPLTSDGNLVVETNAIDPLPIQISSVDVRRQSGIFVAELQFNQPIDFSSLDRALSVSEVRGVGEIEIRLIQGEDFTLEYNSDTHVVTVFFSDDLVTRDLPILGDQPGPGVYRFEIESAFIRATAVRAGLDGNNDGRVDAADDFASQNIIGDAGDKLSPESFTIAGRNGRPDSQVDLYGPVNLNIVLDDANQPDGLPDANETFTIRGAIGDNPDHDVDYYSFSSDADLYSITLQAGQILKLGAMQGPAQQTGRFVIQPNGQLLSGSTAFGLTLPAEPFTSENREFTSPEDFLIRQTGTYLIVIANSTQGLAPGVLPDLPPVNGGVGEYNFTISVFDDGDSGFNADTNAGDGQDLVNAPAPSAFAGNDGKLGTADDRVRIVTGAYTFTYSTGPDGVAGTSDDFVSGSNGSNVSSLTDALGTRMVSVESAIGTPGFAGVPENFFPDVDIFHLNNGNPINAGTVIKATLSLSELGSDLGSFVGTLDDPFLIDNFVQFSIFDTTNSSGSDDALLLYAPSDVSPTGGETGILAESNNVAYGFDENGDFYIEFVAPGRFDVEGAAAKYAIYVQGVLNTDYRLEVVTSGTRELTQRRQNFFLETRGGNVDWLEVNNQVSDVKAFDAGSLGFTGRAENGQRIDQYILDSVTAIVQDTFDGVVSGPGGDGVFGTSDDERGLDINVSTNPADFDFQDYSTIFLSSMFDPREPLFSVDIAEVASAAVFGELFSQLYGVSQHADPGNADRTDDAIVFIPNLSILDYSPSTADLESFIQSLAAVTARRAGELMGLRLTEAYDPTQDVYDVQAVNSVEDVPGDSGEYEFLSNARRLSPSGDAIADSDFFLGYQDASALLRLYTRNG